MTSPPPVRDAATVIVVREASGAPEVLLLRRSTRSGFAGGMWVFPGGVVDAGDRRLDPARWDGLDPDAAATRFAAPADLTLGIHVAAVRETFEEAGLLLARHDDGRVPDVTAPDYAEIREQLGNRAVQLDWSGWLAEQGLVLDLGCLTYLTRWVTPEQEPRRYDTRFFLTRAPAGQRAVSDEVETTEQRWIGPAAALQAHAEGQLAMIYPTIKTLEGLADAGDLDTLVAHAAAQPAVRRIQPHIEMAEGASVRIVHPDDADYPHERYEARP
jgi:8-oxo-dGTP pyrophosphatase MutT (NUDIX family)